MVLLVQKDRKFKNNSHIFKANVYLSMLQLFFLLSFIIQIFAVFLFPNDKHGFTTDIDAWFQTNWVNGSTNSFQELILTNGWIIIYQSLIVIAIWSFLFFFLIEFFILRNNFHISHCVHQNNSDKSHNIKEFFYPNCQACEQRLKLGEKKTRKLFIASLFPFAMIKFWIDSYELLKVGNEVHNYFFSYMESNTIDNKHFFNSIINKEKINKNTFVTGILYLLVVSSFAGAIMMWISYGLRFPIFIDSLSSFQPVPGKNPEFMLYDPFVKLSPLLSTLTYFTQFTNLTCFLYAMTAIFRTHANLFRNNTLTIHLVTYITIVAIIYWVFLFQHEVNVTSKDPTIQIMFDVNLATTSILHGSTPLTFLLYAAIIIWYNKIKPIKFLDSWKNFIIYPVTYGFFMYSLPIFAKPSVYGPFTNLNPFNRNEFSGFLGLYEFPTHGEPLFIFLVLLLWIFFGLIFFLFWFYTMQIHKIYIKTKVKNDKNIS